MQKRTESKVLIEIRKTLYPIVMILSKTKVKYKVELVNNYKTDNDRPVIFACNHSAFPDIPIGLRAIGKHCYTLIGKQNLAIEDKLFFTLTGAIWVDRKDKTHTRFVKKLLTAYLKKKQNILWFPEATWNLTDNLLMLSMRWGIIDVARETNAQIIPMALDYNRDSMVCKVRFGQPLSNKIYEDNLTGITMLRDSMATLRWDFISEREGKRSEIDIHKEQEALFQAVYDYPPLNWNYEKSCIYHLPDEINYEYAFAHLNTIHPTIQSAFLFNKRLK